MMKVETVDDVYFRVIWCRLDRVDFEERPFFLSFFYEVARAPSCTSAETCLAGWPNAQPQGWDKCSVVQHHQACLTMCA